METQDNISKVNESIEPVQEAVAEGAVQEKPAQPEGSRFDHIKETLELLYTLFPKAFIKEGNCKPLKIGIFNDLRAAIEGRDDITVTKCRAALSFYTGRLRYLFSLKEGAPRIDLEGNECETVSKEHADFAKARFDEINTKRRANKPARPKNDRRQGEGKKKWVKKGEGKPAKAAPRPIPGRKAELSELQSGVAVLVVSSQSHYVRGSVAEVNGDLVAVTLSTGMTVSMPLERVLIPLQK